MALKNLMKAIPLLIIGFSCNNQKDKINQSGNRREDSLMKIIEGFKKNEVSIQSSQKKYAFVLISYIKAYEYYYEYSDVIKKIEEEKGNYKNGE